DGEMRLAGVRRAEDGFDAGGETGVETGHALMFGCCGAECKRAVRVAMRSSCVPAPARPSRRPGKPRSRHRAIGSIETSRAAPHIRARRRDRMNDTVLEHHSFGAEVG